jgi:hypothetical protein
MPVETGLWRVDEKPVRLTSGGIPTEARLEEPVRAPDVGHGIGKLVLCGRVRLRVCECLT